MRHPGREIKDLAQLETIIHKAQVCRCAFSLHDQPYIVPMNFGYAHPCLYFHCAPRGRKIEMLRENPRVGFELEGEVELLPNEHQACKWETKYQSVIGRGRAAIVENVGEKIEALNVIMRHYAGNAVWNYEEDPLGKMVVIKVEIEEMTGKQSKHYLPPQA